MKNFLHSVKEMVRMQEKTSTVALNWPCVKFSTPENPLTPDLLRKIIQEGRRVCEDPSTEIPGHQRHELISQWAERWRNARSPWRRHAEQLLPETSKLSKPMLNACLDLFFRSIKREALEGLTNRFPRKRRQLVGHILPGNVLAASAESFLVDLILGHVNVVKVSSKSPIFPLLIAESLSEIDPRLGQLISVLSWKGGQGMLDASLAHHVDRLVVYGTAETIESIRRVSPLGLELDAYGPGTAVGAIGRRELCRKDLPGLAWRAAVDVSLYDQRGCLSLQTVFVEQGGEVAPEEFVSALAVAMEGVAFRYPPGRQSVNEAASIRQRRQLWNMKTLAGERVFQLGAPSGTWTVFYEPMLKMDEPSSGRMVTVRTYDSQDVLAGYIHQFKDVVQGFAVADMRNIQIWKELGIPHVAEFGALQFAPLAWQRNRS